MKKYYGLILLLYSSYLCSQSVDDWTWYDSPSFSGIVQGLELDNNGDIWMVSGTNVIRFDGVDWYTYDVLESGLPAENAFPRSVDASLSNRLWISTRNRVLELDLETEEWTIYDPANAGPNFSAFAIEVESENEIWWVTGSGLWEYNGTEWIFHNLHMSGLNINTSDFREINIDNENNRWLTTPYTYFFGSGGFKPAGVVRFTETDTTYFNGDDYGFPNARRTYLKLNSNDTPLLAYTNSDTADNFYKYYSDGEWSAPIEIPYQGYMYGFELGREDQIYALFNEFIAVGENESWDVIPLNTDEITSLWSFLVTANNDIYVSGRTGTDNSNYESSFGFLPNLKYRIRGKLYSDRNYDGVFNNMDQAISYHFVQTVNQDRISFSNNNGDYSLLFSDPDIYDIEGILPNYHSFGMPENGIHSISLTESNPISNGHDLGFEPDTTAIDLSVSISEINGVNPGFQACYTVSVKNNAPKSMAGEITLNYDDLLNYVSAEIEPILVTSNQLIFEFQSLEWLEVKNIDVCFLLPPDPNLLGDTLKYSGTVLPNSGTDLTPINNSDSLCQIVVGPFDPNYIAVRPKGEGVTGDILYTTQKLEYTIHFQNIGTDTARNVTISNPIDVDLDIRTLNVIGFSHEYGLTFDEENRTLLWNFDNIYLPDSTSSYIGSNGFVKYTIHLNNNDVGTTISNHADIFFDFNLPITTNSTLNTLIDKVVTSQEYLQQSLCEYEMHINSGQMLVNFPKLDEYLVRVYDLNGRVLYTSIAYNKTSMLNLGHLPRGAYVIFVRSKGCSGNAKVFIR